MNARPVVLSDGIMYIKLYITADTYNSIEEVEEGEEVT